MNKKVLFVSPHPWKATSTLGTHQYARLFVAAGWKVAYVSTPISPVHLAYYGVSGNRAALQLPERLRTWASGGRFTDGVWSYVPFGLVPVANRFPFNTATAMRLAMSLHMPPIRHQLSRNGFDAVDLMWLDSPLGGQLLDRVPHRFSVLRIADDLAGFSEIPRSVVDEERRVTSQVNLVVATTTSLQERAKRDGARRTLLLPNGADFEHFAQPRCAEPEDLAMIPKPRVVYVGAIEEWFDPELIVSAARKRPDISFVVVGQYRSGLFPTLESCSNVHLLGKRPYGVVPAYLHHSQVGIIPFKRIPLIESVNPIKLYEYMAAGLPVVSTRWRALEEMGSPAHLCEGEAEFTAAVEKALTATAQDRSAYVDFARHNTWADRFRTVVGELA